MKKLLKHTKKILLRNLYMAKKKVAEKNQLVTKNFEKKNLDLKI